MPSRQEVLGADTYRRLSASDLDRGFWLSRYPEFVYLVKSILYLGKQLSLEIRRSYNCSYTKLALDFFSYRLA